MLAKDIRQISFLVNNVCIDLTRKGQPYLFGMATTGGVDYATRVIQGLLKQNGWENSINQDEIWSSINFFERDMIYNNI